MRLLIILSLWLLAFSHQVYGQESVNAGGGDLKGSGGSGSFSVGQVFYITASGSSGSVAQGVQQTYIVSVITGKKEIIDRIKLTVFPNPATDKLILQPEDGETENISFQLFDVNGTLLQTGEINGVSSQVPMNSYVSGTYFLKVMKDKEELMVYKIVKN
jgi:hypothetical protein